MSPRSRARHAARPRIPFGAIAVALILAAGGVVAWRIQDGRAGRTLAGGTISPRPTLSVASGPALTPTPSVEPSPPPVPSPEPINTAYRGISTFRGNATRTYYGVGPVPRKPTVIWGYPVSGSLCSTSSDQHGERLWCGTGWTGQPNVIARDGRIEVRVGAYDGSYHFLDGRTGEPVRPDLVTGDLAKGSATSDPDGYPLYYAGSRDNLFRVVALDRAEPTVLWSVNADTSVPGPLWNDDWDGAALVIGDYLLEGSENSWLYVIRLHRRHGTDGLVTVAPKIVATIPGFDDRLLAELPDTDVSIESSVAYADGVVYFANSGGLVQGWDISDLLDGGTRYRRVFRFWTGDDTDASVVIDDEGSLYVGSEYQRFNSRGKEVGQLMKLDPRRPDDPLVWSVHVEDLGFEGAGGTWSTPALYDGNVFEAFADGQVMAVDADSGEIVWQTRIGVPSIASPVVVDGVLIQGDCTGALHAWDVSHLRRVRPLWTMDLGACVESTPAVWHGWIYVGTRAGQILGIANPGKLPA
ncbi:MAG TPA: PQQ-binding-like beta-propeller repeat protein [Actinomycetota bacterium]